MSLTARNYHSLLFVIKLSITIALCAVILWKVDWRETWHALQQTNLIILCTVFAGMILNVLVSTLKWKILLSIHGIQFKFSQLCKYYFTASFFNNFLPSTIGGDGYRIYKTFKNPISKAGAFTSVFIERITGISALMFIGFIGGIISYLKTGNEISRLVVFGGSLGLGILIIFFLAMKFTATPLKRLGSKILPKRFQGVTEHLKDYKHNHRKILMVILLSLFFQLFLLFYRLLIIYAVGSTISIANMAVVVALSTIVALVPISINGIGLLDGSFIYLLVTFNVGYEQAFIVMILIRLLNFPLGLIGGIFYFFDKKSLRVDHYGLGELKKT